MNSIAEDILQKCLDTLPNIQQSNGYENSILTVTKGYKSIEECSDFPHLYFFIEFDSEVEPATEDFNKGFITIKVIIAIHFSVNSERGNLTDTCESLLKDILKWRQDTDFETVDGIQHWFLSHPQRTFDFDKNIGTVANELTIRYYDDI